MIDQLSFLAGVFATTAGTVCGQLLGRRLRRPPRSSDPRVCGCGHHLATHDFQKGECLEDVRREHYRQNGQRSGHEWVECGCVRYTGEVPLDLSTLDLPGMPGWGTRDLEESP